MYSMLVCLGLTAGTVRMLVMGSDNSCDVSVMRLVCSSIAWRMCVWLQEVSFSMTVVSDAVALLMLTYAWVVVTLGVLVLRRLLMNLAVLLTLFGCGGLLVRNCLCRCIDFTLREIVFCNDLGWFNMSLAELLLTLTIRVGILVLGIVDSVFVNESWVLLLLLTILVLILSCDWMLVKNLLWPVVLCVVDAVMNCICWMLSCLSMLVQLL